MSRNLPTIKEIYSGDVELKSKWNDLNIILNQEPKQEWIKELRGIKYIPIERIEWLMDNIYIRDKVEVIDYKLIANSAAVHVRLHYLDPISNEWDYQDGLGAAPLQTDAGAGSTDWTKIKSDAVMKALPAAESFAVKDAAEKLGRLFGRDLNRADKIAYDTIQGKFDNTTELVSELLNEVNKLEDGRKEMYKDDWQKATKEQKKDPEFIKSFLDKIRAEK